MSDLVGVVVIQGWGHLFEWIVPCLYEWEVRQFYYNLELIEDGGFDTSAGDMSFHMTEKVLGEILKVDREGIRSVNDYAPTRNFIMEARTLPKSGANVFKKILKKTILLVL